jgi:citrate synthase
MAYTVWLVGHRVNIDLRVNMKARDQAWLDAEAALELLGVSRATLYAYVSRGRIRSEPVPGSTRRRRYARDDVERLRARAQERRNPEKAAEHALRWGLPILESALTLIADGRLYYRGRDAAELARSSSVADVAALLWTGAADGTLFEAAARPVMPSRRSPRAPFVARAQAALALAGANDPLAFDLRARAVAMTGWRILGILAAIASDAAAVDTTIDTTLARAWGVPRAAALLRAALILCADHELNVSTFTARCVASAGAAPYGVVIAGLAALEGVKHGGLTGRVEALWDDLQRAPDLRDAFAERLRRGDAIAGFGHPLYAGGDPRATTLLELLPKTKAAARGREIATRAESVLGEAPTIDFALVALTRALGLPSGTALTLFALGRTLGWIAHAIEQYQHEAVIRPRARYVGPTPR